MRCVDGGRKSTYTYLAPLNIAKTAKAAKRMAVYYRPDTRNLKSDRKYANMRRMEKFVERIGRRLRADGNNVLLQA